jgi:hypothetical protein
MTAPGNRRKTGGGRFAPGQSGNPSGRPRSTRDFTALAQERSPRALDRLEAIASGRGMPAVKANELILAYGHGRPTLNVNATNRGGPLPPAFAGAARAQLERALADAAPKDVLESALSGDPADSDVTDPEGDE